MKTPRNRCFPIESYYKTVMAIVIGDKRWAAGRLSKMGLDASPLAEDIGGVFLASEDKTVMAIYLTDRHIPHLVHELVHAAMFVLDEQLGTSMDFESSETVAYFVQDMLEKVMRKWA